MATIASSTKPDERPKEGVAVRAQLYRMATPEHTCPFGIKARALLQRKGIEVEDHLLRSRAETDQFKEAHHVQSTPQIFLEGRRIGGYDSLREYFGLRVKSKDETTYQPVLATFGTGALLAVAARWGAAQELVHVTTLAWCVAISMGLLALLKLRDLESFSNQFLGYDLLAQRAVPYAYLYPFLELLASVGMVASVASVVVGTCALFIGSEGAISVIKAVYIDKRELKCACVGGNSKVPLGFVSLTENLLMVGMALWILFRTRG